MSDEIPSEIWTGIMAKLTERLKAPSAELPNVRWLSEYHLRRLLLDVAITAKAPATLSGRKLLRMLVDSKLARQLPPDVFSGGAKSYAIYSLELGGLPSISPIELLQATQPSYQNTVICYFTALAYHELTTQETPHHHVATLKKPTKRPQPETLTGQTPAEKSAGESSLGTLLFRYQDVPYYFTQRDRALMPGIQTVRLSPSCQVRITTLEQTLLDTLHRPWSCGGPSVVFEAWERGLPILDDTRLAQYLRMINRADYTRRAGYMLEQFGHAAADSDLHALLTDAKAKLRSGVELTIPLLADAPTPTKSTDWGIVS